MKDLHASFSEFDTTHIQTHLQAKLPQNINLFFDKIANCQRPLFADELLLTADASGSRKREFVAGRNALKFAAGKYHESAISIGRRPTGEPVLPSHLVGSISHKSPFVIAIAAKREHFASIGIDLDTIDEWNYNAVLAFTSENKLRRYENLGLSHDELYSLLFSIKESVFKALYPLFQLASPSISKIHPNISKCNKTEFSFSFAWKDKCVNGKGFIAAPWIVSVAWYHNNV